MLSDTPAYFFCLDYVEDGRFGVLTCPKPKQEAIDSIHLCCPRRQAFDSMNYKECKAADKNTLAKMKVPIDGHLVDSSGLKFEPEKVL